MVQALIDKSRNFVEIVEDLRKFIFENDCPDLSVDISHMNLIDASKVSVMCSTYHWAKYPNGVLKLKTSDSVVEDIIKPLNIGNVSVVTE